MQRLLSRPKNYTYQEAKTLLNRLGFNEDNKGKTSGSRVKFVRDDGEYFLLHKPHPGNILHTYVILDLIKFLRDIGEI